MELINVTVVASPANTKKEAKEKVNAKAYTIWYHLFKIMMLGNITGSYRVWAKEIANKAVEIQNIKCSVRLTEEDYDTELWGGYNDRFSNSYSRMLKKFYAEYPSFSRKNKPTVNQVHTFFTAFFKSYCSLLAGEAEVTVDIILSKLNKLHVVDFSS